MRKSKTCWREVCNYFREDRELYTERDLHSHVGTFTLDRPEESTIDNYRRLLEKAGYIRTIGGERFNHQYEVDMIISRNLSMSKVKWARHLKLRLIPKKKTKSIDQEWEYNRLCQR